MQANQPEVVKHLIHMKAPVDQGTRFDETPLDICLLYKSCDALAELLKSKANPDRLNRFGITPTQVAMMSGDRQLIQMLVQAYRPSERDLQRIAALDNKSYNSRELAMKEQSEYSEAFYKEHDRMWGPYSGHTSII